MQLGVVGIKIKAVISKIYTAVKNGLIPMLCKVIGVLRTLVTRLAQFILSQFVKIKLNIKPWLVQFTNQVLLIKVGLILVLHKLGQIGQQLLTIARKIHQRVLSLLKRGN